MTTATGRPTSTESLEEPQIAQQLQAAESRLVDRYRDQDGITADRVRHAFATISSRFVGARVRSFLPILIERAVQFELDH